ncbi:PREDICTED: BLOC-1-related complex subunit 8 homolog [Tarenaya hassleriana]|uniref:BLOC-1-related complex subunit 8 homolog n=1 Tax=Tarenaya hassleriana TaxID=28532 RepID=UPI00053C143F|nr:PREDICTED: BLOC-1-related complex subunit 8 homolog [Tarenaya hassleriana]XP_010555803.1 PREDICTED: BLOC-1-related complex subunit 8 homolog [Tarenaya hassleriana]XP_010555804.1 PREDICTED: BLOC-1-related complex subunit 8 homolog [Tarenaya hassleriana]
MHEFSTADGFLEINESLDEMIKYIANEPSVGLYFIQQHVRNAVPNVINLQNDVLEKSRGTVLHTEDLEDSITMVKSMKECGSPIADEMIRDIKNSLAIMSTKQPRRGLILNTSPWSRSSSSLLSSDVARESESSGYLSSVFKSAKQRASNIKWPQLDFKEQELKSDKEDQTRQRAVALHVASARANSSGHPDVAGHHELHDTGDEVSLNVVKTVKDEHVTETAQYDEFKAGKEANLKAWLGDMDGKVDAGGNAAERI